MSEGMLETIKKLHISERGNPRIASFLSELYHFVNFMLKTPTMELENGMFIVSIDVDVGSKELGVINKGRKDVNVGKLGKTFQRDHTQYSSEYSIGKIEELAFPLFVDLFDDLEIPATFAIRGQLTEVDGSIIELLRESRLKHDIGSHGYYHRPFRNLSQNEAEDELKMISVSMKKFGIIPRSFVFPYNSVAYLNLLQKYGYECYRSHGGYAGINDCMYIEKQGRLYNIHPSLSNVDQSTSTIFPKKILNVSIAKKLPFHMWFHLWSFGTTTPSIQRSINRVLFPLLKYASKKRKMGVLTFETMLSAAKKVERLPRAH